MNGLPSKTVGVLGGMGPAATADFFNRVVAACSGGRDQDHLRLIIDNNPFVPDRNAASGGEGEAPGPVLAGMARGLQGAGAEVLVMPCNAAHAYEADIRAATPLPFVSMIEASVEAVRRRSPAATRVGVLAADACLEARVYQNALERRGLSALEPMPGDQARFMTLLYRIKAGDTGQDVRAAMAELARALVERGAEILVAGCTEVPLVLQEADASAPLVSSTDALVTATIAAARGHVADVKR